MNKRLVTNILLALMCVTSICSTTLEARRRHHGHRRSYRRYHRRRHYDHGIGMGFIGAAMIIGAASSSHESSKAEKRAIRAEEKAKALEREQQKERVRSIIRKLSLQDSEWTLNMLVIAVTLLLLSVFGIGIRDFWF